MGAGARVPVGIGVVHIPPLRAGTWRCCGGRGSTTACGISRCVNIFPGSTTILRLAWVRQQPEWQYCLLHKHIRLRRDDIR